MSDEKPLTQAQQDAKTWADAEKQFREDQIKAKELRDKEALKIEVTENHPLHPAKATNPTNITSPADHGPAVEPFVMGTGEP